MPQVITSIQGPQSLAPNRIRWTREQCRMIADAGVLVGRYELIEGEIYTKMGQSPPHAYVVRAVMAWLVRLFGEGFVQAQLPIQMAATSPDYNEPEPDVAVLTEPYQHFAERHPQPREVRLLVEVSDSSLAFDLGTKASLYAQEGIVEYWVIDVPGRRLVVMRGPGPDGYSSIVAYTENERCAPLAKPDAEVIVRELLPPQ